MLTSMENGNPVNIDVVRLGPGWACIRAGGEMPPPGDLPRFLHQALTDWLKENPGYRVRETLPIVSQGNTFAIHVWFDHAP
jgi:hypothetical protein